MMFLRELVLVNTKDVHLKRGRVGFRGGQSPDCAKKVVPAIVDQGVKLNAPHDQTVISFSSLLARQR